MLDRPTQSRGAEVAQIAQPLDAEAASRQGKGFDLLEQLPEVAGFRTRERRKVSRLEQGKLLASRQRENLLLEFPALCRSGFRRRFHAGLHACFTSFFLS